jgi:hypothetical protein
MSIAEHNSMKKKLLIPILCLLQYTSAVSQVQPYRVTIYDSTATLGYYFLVPARISNPALGIHSQMILDRFGDLVYYRPLGVVPNTPDFKMQPNGMITYFLNTKFYIVDSTFTVIDSVACKNGLTTDIHEFQILPNGNFLLFGYENVVMDLSAYDWFKPAGSHGSSSASVKCNVIQEQDPNKNVVFEWHAKDYFSFTDADSVWYANPNVVDWTHSNALELDDDGNILMSSRHFNEITKINRTDSSIMWRLGGVRNQFTFLNDTVPFYGQHDIRRIANGNITLLDDGFRVLSAPYHGCRALEYQLDEVNKTASLVWSYVYDSAMYSRSTGNMQRLPNGNTLVNYGTIASNNVTFAVVDSMKNKVFELAYDDTFSTYRAFNFQQMPWMFHRPVITCFDSAGVSYLDAGAGYPVYQWSNGETTRIIAVTAADTFKVWVPYGPSGFISSERLFVTNSLDPCDLGTSISETSMNNVIEIYPNPAGDKLYISNPSPFELSEFSLYNVLGEKVMKGELSLISHVSTVDVSALPTGLYVLLITLPAKTQSVKLIIE